MDQYCKKIFRNGLIQVIKKSILLLLMLIPQESLCQEKFQKNFTDIFNTHLKFWKNEYTKEITIIENNQKKYAAEKITSYEKDMEIKTTKSIKILKKIVEKKNNDLEFSEASFKLALYSYFSKKMSPEECIKTIELGFLPYKKYYENKKLFVRMHLLAADIRLSLEHYDKAKKHYEEITNKTNELKKYEQELIRAYLGLGDSYFGLMDFLKSFESYQKSYELIKNFNFYLKNEALFRLMWSSYRNAEYSESLKYVYELAKENNFTEISRNLVQDIINIGAICLYELKSVYHYKLFSKNDLTDGFLKKIILKSFDIFSNSGFSNEIEKYSKNIEDSFFDSKLFVPFIRTRLLALQKSNNIEKYQYLIYSGTALISKNSFWKSKFELNEEEENLRKSTILKFSREGAQYYYNLGNNTKSKTFFFRSAEIYLARIQENFPLDQKDQLLQSYAHALFMAEEYQLAWNAAQESLKFSLNLENKKNSLFLLVKIARIQSKDCSDDLTPEFQRYEKAVRNYFTHFPDDPQARMALFESAKRSEILKNYETSRQKYEKILSAPPLSLKEDDIKEKNKVFLSLAQLYLKMGNNSLYEAFDLESSALEKNLSKQVMEEVFRTNYNLAIKQVKLLQKEGKIKNAAQFLALWAKNYSLNPYSPDALIQSIEEFGSLQEWNAVLQWTDFFEKKYSKNKKAQEALFWKAKALDMLLQFSKASRLYEKFSSQKKEHLNDKKRIFALTRAFEIYESFSKKEDALRVFVELSQIKNQKKIEIEFGKKLFYLEDYEKSKLFFKKYLSSKLKDSKDFKEAKIFYLASCFYNEKNRPGLQKEFNKEIIYLTNIKYQKKYRDKIISFMELFLKLNYDNFIIEKDHILEKKSLEKIKDLEIQRELINKIFKNLKKGGYEKNFLYSTGKLFSKLSDFLSKKYSKYFYSKEKNDDFLKKSSSLKDESKKMLYELINYTNDSLEEKSIVSSMLYEYTKRNFNITPKETSLYKYYLFSKENFIENYKKITKNVSLFEEKK